MSEEKKTNMRYAQLYREQIDRVGWDILYHGSDSAEAKDTRGV